MSKQSALQVQQWFAQAVAYHQQDQFESAAALYEQILALEPRHFDALWLSGALAGQTKDYERAIRLLTKALKLNPAHARAHNSIGIALQESRQPDRALASYDRAIRIQPDYAEAHSNRGTVLKELKRFEEALASFERAIAIRPGYAEAFNNRGNVLKELGRFDAAIASFDRAIAIRPDYAEAHGNRGLVLKEMKQFEAALESYERAIAFEPRLAEAFYNRAVLLHETRRFDAALQSYDSAIAIRRDYAQAHCNRGVLLQDLKRFDGAIESYDRALAIDPHFAEAYWNKALTLLLGGNYEEGWTLHEWRWQRGALADIKLTFRQPLWLGEEALRGKTILLHAEQGLGDAIQFCRYAKDAKALGARVVLEVHRSLQDLMRSVEGVDDVFARGDALPPFDYHCPLLSLPLAFKTRLATVPASRAYVRADTARIGKWQERLGRKARPRVGLAWSGAMSHANDRNRSVALADLCGLLSAQFEFITLQNEIRDADSAALAAHPEIRHFGDELTDFTQTAALCELMDVVISVDTSVAHLAGALGKEVWILLPFIPDWRWLLDRDDSPWYPSARLFRQPQAGDWTSVIGNIKDRLASLAFAP